MSLREHSVAPRVLLCYPSVLPGHKPKYGLQPLGILYIAGLLRENGVPVKVLDGDIGGLSCAEMAERILQWEPDLVGFSLMTPQLMSAIETARLLKKTRPQLMIAFGGAHIDSTHEDVFSMTDCIDFAVYNEGEYATLEVVQNLHRHGLGGLIESLRGVGNVIYKNGDGEVVKNRARPFLPELDGLPPVDYDMLDIGKYSIPTASGRYVISMMLSRGCPFKCTFCDAPLTMGKKIRFQSIGRVIRDIRHYVDKYGCRDFVFKDSTFSANRKWAEAFCDALIASGLNIAWRCNTRVNLVPQPLLEKMKKAGCHIINFGVESGHPEILKRIKKEVDLEEIEDAHRRCRKVGIRTYATFMVGNPGETAETAQATIDLACRIRPTLASFSICKAYPGTPLYEQAVAEGIVEPRWWADQAWDPSRNSAFEARWQLTRKGGLDIPGFDSEYWQKRATRAFYLRPYFVLDTLASLVTNPYFLRHIFNLGAELLPFYKIQLPWNGHGHGQPSDHCPSLPTVEYEARQAGFES